MTRKTLLWIVVIVLSVFLIVTAVRPYAKQSNESFIDIATSKVSFMIPREVAAFFQEDEDKYVQSLTQPDLYARKMKSAEDYKNAIVAAAIKFTPAQEERLTKLANDVDKYLIQSGQTKLASIPWIFAVTKGDAYENGYPHTRKNIIFLSSNDLDSVDLGNTILHEKVHVYQRHFPEDVQRELQKQGYKPVKLRQDDPLSRSNPDLDEWIYLDPVTKKPMMARYSSSQPSSISDVILDHPAYEHPFEKMAYDVANKFVATS